MIIKSHIRGGYRAAADYLKAVGENEKIRLVEISDPDAKNLDEAFKNMWSLASNTKCTKPLHHISINPFKDERLTDEQVLKIVERCEQKYGYKPGEHQRVIVEHIKDGRQHFHVIWNRVNMDTGRVVWPGHHWKKSKQAAREMEKELGLKRPMPRRMARPARARTHTRIRATKGRTARRETKARPTHSRNTFKPGKASKPTGRYQIQRPFQPIRVNLPHAPRTGSYAMPTRPAAALPLSLPLIWMYPRKPHRKHHENEPVRMPMPIRPRAMTREELIAWAWANGRWDILAMFGIYVDYEPA